MACGGQAVARRMTAALLTRQVVLRWAPGTKWHICYAASYAPAFRSAVNSFEKWSGAVLFVAQYNARPDRDCDMKLVYHEWDQLRQPMSEAEFYAFEPPA